MTTKMIHWTLSTLSFVGVLVLLTLHFLKEEKEIVFIDTPRLVANYQGMIAAKTAYKEKVADWSANIDTLQKEVQTITAEYESQQAKLSEEEKFLHRELIKTKQEQLLQYRKAIESKAQQEDQQMTQEVITEINAFIKAYGERNNLDIVIGATQMGNVAYAKEYLDITDELLTELNATR